MHQSLLINSQKKLSLVPKNLPPKSAGRYLQAHTPTLSLIFVFLQNPHL